MKKKLIIVGGGAAGFFTAANIDSAKYEVTILEKSKRILQKVKIAGGGRCNVTHACFNPKELVSYYPRGHKELLGVFTKFQPGDTMAWFEDRGVELKAEKDNRMFPTTNSSQTIIDTLISACAENDVQIKTSEGVKGLTSKDDNSWEVVTAKNTYKADLVLFCTGGAPKGYKLLENIGLKIVDLVPSLFTFNIKNKIIEGFMGTSFPQAEVKIPHLKQEDSGPLLITHWGLSGPAILKLSAWCARELHKCNYKFEVIINFLGIPIEHAKEMIQEYKTEHAKKSLGQSKIFDITQRFWNNTLDISGVLPEEQISQLSKKEMNKILEVLCHNKMEVTKKSTFKEEFVTSGGVDLKQIDFSTMKSKQHHNLYLAGEVLDIDALTGGFNFQACWSEAWLIAQDLNQAEFS